MNKLIPRISGCGYYTRVYTQTHVFKVGVHKVFQWVLFDATLYVAKFQFQWKTGKIKNNISIKTKDNAVPNTMNLLFMINP